MDRDKIRPRDAVAVEEDAVGAARSENCAVADFRGAEAAIFMPDAVEPAADFPIPGIDHGSGRLGRTVVGHHDLEIPLALAGQRTQHRIERIFAVIRGYDDGNQVGHGHPLGGRFS